MFNVKARINFHVMLVGLGAFPIILGRPWLMRVVGAIQDWQNGTFTLGNQRRDKQIFYIISHLPLEDEQDGNTSEESTDSSYTEVEISKSSSEDESNVSMLLLGEDSYKEEEDHVFATKEDECLKTYDEIEELMQPKSYLKRDMVGKMLSQDLVPKEKEEHLCMLTVFSNLFITLH